MDTNQIENEINNEENKTTFDVGEVTSGVIKKLSGGDVTFDRKLIDNLIAVTNSAGGTGASTLVNNIAYMASKKGMRVLVVDLNILYPIQHNYFNIKQNIERPDLISFLMGKNSLGESIITRGNVSVLFANNRSLMDNINAGSDMAIANFRAGIERMKELYDLIIVDTPMQVESLLPNTLFYMCDHIYTVWDEGIASIANTERIRRNMALSGIEAYNKMSVILNKRTSIHYSDFPFKKLNIELLGILPFDSEIIDSSLRSQIFCQGGESSSSTSKVFYNEISDITDKILANGGYRE